MVVAVNNYMGMIVADFHKYPVSVHKPPYLYAPPLSSYMPPSPYVFP
jgi:hypothetical protein